MFNQIFKYPSAINRHRTAPFSEQRAEYLEHRAVQGASIGWLRITANYLLAIISYLNLQPEGEIGRREILAAAERWIVRPDQHGPKKDSFHAKKMFINHATHWLKYLHRLRPEPMPFCPETPRLSEYIDYLTHERGYSPTTIGLCRRRLTTFLRQACQSNRSLCALSIPDIDQAITQTTKNYSRLTVRSYVSTLRSFFRYAENYGWCVKGVPQALRPLRVYSGETLPLGPSWNDVQRLLSEAEGDNRIQIRDRAILLLFAVYGLRKSEVRRLLLEDIDWQRELLIINRSKPLPRPHTYPLQQTVGDSILRYLKEVRQPSHYREIFLSLNSPVRPLSATGLYHVVNRRLRSLNLLLKHNGPHALRHACASHLLAEGLSLKEIGDHLGHRCYDTTAKYAKVDLAALRQVGDFRLGGLI